MKNEKVIAWMATLLLMINSLGALCGGALLMIDSSGRTMQLPQTWLQHTAFANFFIPGLILFLVNGIGNMLVLALVLLRHPYRANFIVLAGGVLVVWILVQRLWTQLYHPLQWIMAGIGLLLLICGYVVRRQQLQVSGQ